MKIKIKTKQQYLRVLKAFYRDFERIPPRGMLRLAIALSEFERKRYPV